jgi:hypothetical protein
MRFFHESHARNCILIKYSLDSGNSIVWFWRVWLWSFVSLYLSYACLNWMFGKWMVLNDNVSKFKLEERNTYSSALSHLFDNICLMLFWKPNYLLSSEYNEFALFNESVFCWYFLGQNSFNSFPSQWRLFR